MASCTPKRVSQACQRCKRQKLKCDTERPCTLCTRAGIECVTGVPGQWRAYQISKATDSARSKARDQAKRKRLRGSSEATRRSLTSDSLAFDPARTRNEGTHTPQPTVSRGEQQLAGSSSTMSFVDGVFRLYNAPTTQIPSHNAIPGPRVEFTRNTGWIRNSHNTPLSRDTRSLATRPGVKELISLLPKYDAAMLLVDTYFDCVHWFVLLFHQDDFRRRWQSLYECPADRRAGQEAEIDSPDLGFIGTFLMVVAIGIEYLGTYRKQLLDELHVDYESLQSRIFTAIRSRFLDIVAWGSLESTQTCVLLGTYYLFHGDPASAWPVCGCALRTALALGLHRKQRPPEKVAGQALLEWRNYNEARKRCWWAIYEIETFCSMSYGYPHAITDAGWDVEPLDPSARSPSQSTMGTSPTSFEQPLMSEPSLLSYKYLMSKLSVIIQQVLVQLYRIGPATGMNEPSRLFSSPDIPVELVGELDRKLRDWKAEIPAPLQIYWTAPPDGCYTSSEELDRDVGASGPRFWSHVFQLQALTLNLAYENARILIHRPLLSARFKIAHGDAVGRDTGSSNEGPLSRSLQTCRDAALQTARFLSVPVMALAAETYAAAFIGIHTFTAGLTLCILFNTDPLSPRSYEVKLGLQRLIAIQQKLKAHSPLPAQSLEILKYLVRHAMEKEWSAMLNGPQLVISGASSDSHDHQGEITNPIQPIVGVSVPESEVPVLDDPHSTPAVMTRDISSALVDGPAGSDVYFNEGGQQHIQDSTLLQAITDVDRVIAGSYSSYLLDQEGPNASWWSLPDQLSFPEQAWIWRTD